MILAKKTRILSLVSLVALGFVALAVTSARSSRATNTPTTRHVPRSGSFATETSQPIYVKRGRVKMELLPSLNALGDRLEKPGKERLTETGTLTIDHHSMSFAAVLEFPDRLRLTIQNGPQLRVITFDGQQARSIGAPLESAERDTIETLVYDAAEHFFSTQTQGKATRFLGSRFRTDDGSAPNYGGPYYDIYQVADQIKTSTEQRQEKHYYFNSDTLLLDRVSYQIDRAGATVRVDCSVGDWQKEQGQQIARRIERIEDGKSVFVFTVGSAILSPRVDDGIF